MTEPSNPAQASPLQPSAQTESADSESWFRALSDSSPHGVFHCSPAGNITYTNRRCEEIFGRSSAQGSGEEWMSSIHPDDFSAVNALWVSAAVTGGDFDAEYRIFRPDGTMRRIHTRARPVMHTESGESGFVGSVEDVTEQTEILRRLKASEEHLRRLYEATPAMLHSVDPQGRLLTVSDRWLAKLGYQREEVLGRHSWDFLTPESRERAHREVIPILLRRGFVEAVEYQLQTRGGKVIDVLLSATVEYDGYRQPLRIVAVFRDITQRKRAEAALHDERARLAYIIAATHIGTWEHNLQTGEFRSNQRLAEIVGRRDWETSAAATFNSMDIAHPDDRARALDAYGKHLDGAAPRYECEVRIAHVDGGWVWVHARGQISTWTADGKPEWIFGTHQDITERKLQEEALRTSQGFLDRTGRLAGVGGWEVDLTTGITTFSNEACRIYGVEPGYCEHLDKGIRLLVGPAQEEMRAATKRCIDEGRQFDVEFPVDHSDGRRLWVRAVGSATYEDGRVVRVAGACQDVTARVAERQALQQANERVALATDSGRIGIWDFDIPQRVYVWDEWMYRLYGRQRGGKVSIEEWLSFMHPDDRDRAVRAANAAVEGKSAFDTEVRVIWPDGSEHYLHLTGHVICDASGQAIRMVGANWDVTEARQLSAALAEQHELLRVTLRSIGEAVITSDASGRPLWLNPLAERMTGWSADEVRGRSLADLFRIVDGDTRQPLPDPVAACIEQNRVVIQGGLTVMISRDGREYGVECSAAPIHSAAGEVLGGVLVFRDVSEQRRLSAEMAYRATHDLVTGLLNRGAFETRLERALDQAQRGQARHACLYIDLDQFKLVNDACGHTIGDEALRQVAKLLAQAVRPGDTLARLGGDEFAVIVEDCDTAQALAVAENICERFESFRFVHNDQRFRIGTSIGLVPVDTSSTSLASVMQAADTSCYAAKEAGRNRVHLWSDTDLEMRQRHGEMQWASRIERALDENRLKLFAQRIVPLTETAQGIHAEVLLRMQNNDGILVLPSAFLPAAERFHLASRLDRWVLKQVIDWMQELPAQPRGEIEMLGVNLSGHSIGDRSFHRWAIEILSAASADIRSRLCLEITETAAVTNLADAAQFIQQIRSIGVRVALDDFGAGVSSFGYLKRLPVDFLKIDGQFVRNLVKDPLDAAAVRCFADVARLLGVKTVAEWVDAPEVIEALRAIGIDFAQGFYLHRPAPLDDLLLAPSAARSYPAVRPRSSIATN